MHQTETFLYGEDSDIQILGMPYKADLAMFVFLPKERYGLADFVKPLSGQKLIQLIRGVYETKVIVEMPKFRLEKSLQLKSALAALGMKEMFDANNADFSKINGKKDLYVSAVIHKAFIEVNEEGSEAAAATAVVMKLRCAPARVEEPKSFVADHAFMFCIFDKRRNSVLFVGKLFL